MGVRNKRGEREWFPQRAERAERETQRQKRGRGLHERDGEPKLGFKGRLKDRRKNL